MKIKISKSKFLIIIMSLCAFPNMYFFLLSKPLHLVTLIFESVIVFLGWAHYIKIKKIETIDFLIVLYFLLGATSTVLNNEGLYEFLRNSIQLLFFHVSVKLSLDLDAGSYIKYSAQYLFFMTTINTACAFITYPEALFYYDNRSPAYFLGGDNTSTRIYIIAVMFSVLYKSIDKKRKDSFDWRSFISVISFLAFSIVCDTANGKICSSVMLIGFICFEIFRIPMLRRPISLTIIVNCALFWVLVVFENIEVFSQIIVNILKRDLTISTRTVIWEITFQKIYEHPLMGNGYMSSEKFESMLPDIIGVNAHNTILMVVFYGGVILLFVFLWILFMAARKYERIHISQKAWVIPVAFMALFLRAQVEGGDAAYIIYFAILMNAASIIKQLIDSDESGETGVINNAKLQRN